MPAIVIDVSDSVATAIADHGGGAIDLIGARRGRIEAQPVPAGHKLALRAIAADEAVVKYGAVIGLATRAIAAGEHVHLHNCRSCLDARSATLDPASGAATDTPYV
jgi:altronate dehydratase small subunit